MRRSAMAAGLAGVLLAAGCGRSVPYRNVGVGRTDPAVVPAGAEEGAVQENVPRFSRQAVPDAVMLRGQADAGYQDSPATPPF